MNRMPQRHAAFTVPLLAIMLIGAVTPASADYSDHEGTFVIFNVGFGVDIQIDNGTALFAEARYHHAYMPGVDMDVIPISFGFRW